MSYLVLARKYRPQAFDQVIEQEHITRTLSNAIAADRIAHAILFSGPRGTGKTTVARILAKAMNCKEGPTPVPCNDCRSCKEITAGHAVDVFEIDGASNNSVDQVRELRENIKYMPAHSTFKIYIIDEVHMLSAAAFNALLKTLEEPPAHILFMFATTESHKIPITILSRCQRHDLRRIHLDSILSHMAWICRQENFTISELSLGVIAREAGGSMRDALSLLDQIMSCSREALTHEQVLDLLGVIDRKLIYDLAQAVIDADIPTVLDTLDDIYNRGHDMKKLYADLLEHFRNLLVANFGRKADKLIDLPSGEIEGLVNQARQISAGTLNQIFELLFKEDTAVRLSTNPKMALEMALIRLLQAKPTLPIDALIDKLDDLRQEMGPSAQGPGQALDQMRPPLEEKDLSNQFRLQPPSGDRSGEPESTQSETFASSNKSAKDPAVLWQQIIKRIVRNNPSLAAILAKCKIKKATERSLDIEVPGNGFTLNMIQREKNMSMLRQACVDITGSRHEIQFTFLSDNTIEGNHQKKKKDLQLKQKALSHPLVADAIEIFGGKLIDVKIL